MGQGHNAPESIVTAATLMKDIPTHWTCPYCQQENTHYRHCDTACRCGRCEYMAEWWDVDFNFSLQRWYAEKDPLSHHYTERGGQVRNKAKFNRFGEPYGGN